MIGRRGLWLGAFLAAAPAPALAQDMCAALDRIAAASRERVPFGSLHQAARDGTLVPRFREQDCRVLSGRGLHCYRNLAPRALDISQMLPTLRDCLRRAPVHEPRQPRLTYDDAALVFRARGLRYTVRNDCNRSCRAGLLASLDISLDRTRNRR